MTQDALFTPAEVPAPVETEVRQALIDNAGGRLIFLHPASKFDQHIIGLITIGELPSVVYSAQAIIMEFILEGMTPEAALDYALTHTFAGAGSPNHEGDLCMPTFITSVVDMGLDRKVEEPEAGKPAEPSRIILAH